MSTDALPQAQEGMSWYETVAFNAVDELLLDDGLSDVFKSAIDHGVSVVTRGEP
jgi:hypothetical protein